MRKGSLALCCGMQSVYIWSDEWHGDAGEEEEMAECIGVPASMCIHGDISIIRSNGCSFCFDLQRNSRPEISLGHLMVKVSYSLGRINSAVRLRW